MDKIGTMAAEMNEAFTYLHRTLLRSDPHRRAARRLLRATAEYQKALVYVDHVSGGPADVPEEIGVANVSTAPRRMLWLASEAATHGLKRLRDHAGEAWLRRQLGEA